MKSLNALGIDFTALTHLWFSVALYMYILAQLSTCFKLWILRSNWQNSQRCLHESLEPLNHSGHLKLCLHSILSFNLLFDV